MAMRAHGTCLHNADVGREDLMKIERKTDFLVFLSSSSVAPSGRLRRLHMAPPRRRLVRPGMVWYGMVEVCEGAPVAVSGWVLTDRHDRRPCAASLVVCFG